MAGIHHGGIGLALQRRRRQPLADGLATGQGTYQQALAPMGAIGKAGRLAHHAHLQPPTPLQ